MERIKKAVIPAAGRGSRLSPITSYLPKAMLPLGKKPVLHHIVDELLQTSIKEIAVIAKSNQTAIFKYFREWSQIQIIIDDTESGPGGAVLSAEEFVGGESFLVSFADAPIWGEGKSDYIQQLLELKNEKEADEVIGVYKIPKEERSSRGVVMSEGSLEINIPVRLRDIIEKPKNGTVESCWAAVGRYVLDQHIFKALKEIDEDDKGERQITTAIRHIIKKGGQFWGLPLDDELKRYDTGTFKGYYSAVKDVVLES
ncbi:sugar phosphate nucleotidyltransferase [Fodinibius halophilus]|uniref:UTP--glucose-1-phosphate uridylyltransferase n=1 Tax=Fodinibius halophilus TaxID=1736908 RepID=A0A6M1T5C2_9BACT|nr:sugar phosphate nucleotidyltransferase [Fodinibius halophilus]NGP87161.1 NTP transferase domain-containing protein [Fodinibius halophilus]